MQHDDEDMKIELVIAGLEKRINKLETLLKEKTACCNQWRLSHRRSFPK
jgi:hypothetical protein